MAKSTITPPVEPLIEILSVRDGWKSSEFVGAVLAMVAVVLINSGILPIDSTAEKVVATLAPVLTAIAYGAWRTKLKASAAAQANDRLRQAQESTDIVPPPPGA